MNAEELLRKVPLFQGLDKKHLGMLAKTAHERSFPAGQAIVQEGESGIGLFVVGSGQVEVVQQRGGQETRLRTLGPGAVFGELGLLTDHPRTATVRATEPTSCLVVTSWNFRALLDESPIIAKEMLGTVAKWLVEAEDRAAAKY